MKLFFIQKIIYYSFLLSSSILLSNNLLYAQGFSKVYQNGKDTTYFKNELISDILYHPSSKRLFIPMWSRTSTDPSTLQTYWLKLDEEGTIIDTAIERVDGVGTYYNSCNSLSWDDSSRFIGAGGMHFRNDSFMKFFLQQRDTNLQVKWRKEYNTNYEYVYPVSYFPISKSSNMLVINMYNLGHRLPMSTENMYFIKTDTQGNEIWSKQIISPRDNGARGVVYTPDHHIIVCASNSVNYSLNNDFGASVIKFDTLGNKIWEHYYNLPTIDYVSDILATNDGHYVIVGYTFPPDQINGMSNSAGRIFKIDDAGNLVWDKIFDLSPRSEQLEKVSLATNGDIIAYGSTSKYYAYDMYNYMVGSTREPDGWVVRLDPAGNKIWNRVFGHNQIPHSHEYIWGGLSLADQGFIAGGCTHIMENRTINGTTIPYERQSGWLVRLDENGCVDELCSEITGLPVDTNKANPIFDLSLYPNPGNGNATIHSNHLLKVGTKIEIYNSIGQTVKQLQLHEDTRKITIDFKGVPGIYLIRLSNSDVTKSFKYLLQ